MPLKSVGGKFPTPLKGFLGPFDLYKQHDQTIHVTGAIYHGKEYLETHLFQPVGEKFLHCIITNSDMSSWVLITKLDVFISNKKDLNGCGYSAPAENIATFSVKTTVEKNKGRPFSELIIQCGDYQLVATAGLYGDQDHVCGAFLGSSVPTGIGSNYDKCFTLVQQKDYQAQHRHLRDYKKEGAKLKAGYTSTIFKNHGFYGEHPLWYTSNDTVKSGNLSTVASKIICHYLHGRVTAADLKHLLYLFVTLKALRGLLEQQGGISKYCTVF